jgi:glucose-1-phosphate thymidylyltransferase
MPTVVKQTDPGKRDRNPDPVGIIPAAGKASRISPLPCSKELMPMGWVNSREGAPRPKVVSQYLLDKYRAAGVSTVYFILRSGKWDIPGYYGDGSAMDMNFAYLLMNLPHGVPYTVDQAYPFVRDAKVMLGFPDMLFGPENAFALADETLIRKNADMVIGLYPPKDEHQVKKCDMVQWDTATGRIEKIVVKPELSALAFIWIFAVWTPVFSRFMHDYLKAESKARRLNGDAGEIHLGHVVQEAITAGLKVYGHAFPEQHFIDIGTPDELAQAYCRYGHSQPNVEGTPPCNADTVIPT